MSAKHFDIDAAGVYSNLDKTATKRRTYTKKPPAGSREAEERAETLRTQGREGCSLPRINMAFTPTNYEFVKVLAAVTGQTMTRFINGIIDQYREENADLYEQCLIIKAKARGEEEDTTADK